MLNDTHKNLKKNEDGFTLVEAVVAILIITIGLIGTAAAITYALEFTTISRNVSSAKSMIVASIEEVESLRNSRRLDFKQIANVGGVDNTNTPNRFSGFSTGFKDVSLDPGPDGVNGTDDDLRDAGADGTFGTGDDFDNQALDPKRLPAADYHHQFKRHAAKNRDKSQIYGKQRENRRTGGHLLSERRSPRDEIKLEARKMFFCNNSHTCKKQTERGAALAMAIIVVAILSVVALTALTFSSTEARIAGSDLQRTQTFYATEAAMEKMTNDFSNLFRRKMNPTPLIYRQLPAIRRPRSEPKVSTFAQTLVEDSERLDELRAIQGLPSNVYPRVNISDGPYAGLYSSVIPYKMTSIGKRHRDPNRSQARTRI